MPPERSEDVVERVERLLGSVDDISDPVARDQVQELIGAILELYGTGMGRILEVLDEAGPAGVGVRQALVNDGVVASLLLIHGLYPVSLSTRVEEALDEVRPYLHSHGGDVELLGVEDGVVRLRLQGSCNGCPASAATLETALTQAIEAAAPDLLGIEVEGVVAGSRSTEGALGVAR